MKNRLWFGLCAAILAGASAAGAEKGIHIEQGSSASFTWVTQDAHGFRWDISGNGTISDGTNDAYDGGLRLQVGGADFPGYSTGLRNKQGNEVQIGPWEQAGLKISRRIFVNVKAGYCRWIDIFENGSPNPVSVALRYYSNMGEGTARIFTSSGEAQLGEKDWGVVTAGASANSSRPAIVHVFASEDAKLIPRFQYSNNSDELNYNVPLEVPPGKAVALCFFEAQRKSYDEAIKFLKEFDPRTELRTLPAALRRILLNINARSLRVGLVGVDRSDEADLIVLRSGDQVRGTIANSEYALVTEFGEMKFPAERVIALTSPSGAGEKAFIMLTDGQVVAGKLTSGPVKVKLAGGAPLEVSACDIVQAAYRISPAKPDQITPAGGMVELRSGARLGFDCAGRKFEFLAACGKIALAADDLRAIEMDTPAGGLHRAVFRNGSVLAGLLAQEKISLTLNLGPEAQLPRQRVKRVCLYGADAKNQHLTALTLRNTDVLYGKFTDAAWTVRTRFGEVKVTPAEIVQAEFSFQSLGQVKLTLTSGTTISGKLADDFVGFKITPGPQLKIHLGQIRTARPASSAAEDQDEDDQPKPTTQPTSSRRISGTITIDGHTQIDVD